VVVSTDSEKIGDLALTDLVGTFYGFEFNYDGNEQVFMDSIANKTIDSLTVCIYFLKRMVIPPKEPPDSISTKSVGAILQAFTHEMTVHAENMLNFTKAYWGYRDGNGGIPLRTPSASQEHKAFKDRKVPRYEYMSARAQEIEREAKGPKQFWSRENADMMSVKI
jgi:hypothetical protein